MNRWLFFMVVYGLACVSPLWAQQALEPVEIQVIDAETKKPIGEFTYSYRITSAQEHDFKPSGDDLTCDSKEGVVKIPAPASCNVSIWVEAKDPKYVAGYGRQSAGFDVTPDGKRRFTMELEPGKSAKGIVIDAATGKPIVGAEVAPVVFMPPLFVGDFDRTVKTDEKGRFEVFGLDSIGEVEVRHPDYFSLQSEPGLIRLDPGVKIAGTVVDEQGKPLEGVEIYSGGGGDDPPPTDSQGAFSIRVPNEWKNPSAESRRDFCYLVFSKDGFPRLTLKDEQLRYDEPMRVEMQSGTTLSGTVLGTDGRPIEDFHLFAAGIEDDEAKNEVTLEGPHAEGRWTVMVGARSVPFDVIVQAPGYAVYHTSVPAEKTDQPLEIRLQSGADVAGGLAEDDLARGPARVMLQSMFAILESWIDNRHRYWWFETQTDPQGQFRFEHVADGCYHLRVLLPDGALAERMVVIDGCNLTLPAIDLPAPGRIVGTAFEMNDPQKPRVNESGNLNQIQFLNDHESRSFVTDEKGRFTIENAPTGENNLWFNFMITADIIGSYNRMARVVPGQTTEVHFDAGKPDWTLRLDVVVGDGSKEQFRAALGGDFARTPDYDDPTGEGALVLDLSPEIRPLQDSPCSWPVVDLYGGSFDTWFDYADTITRGGVDIVVSDIAPGRYRFDFGHGVTADVQTGPEPNVVRFGAGSIVGRAEGNYPQILAVSLDTQKVYRGESLGAYGDSMAASLPPTFSTSGYGKDGKEGETPTVECRLRVPLLPAGRYRVVCLLADGRWAAKEVSVVEGQVTELGELSFQPGGVLEGEIVFHVETRLPTSIRLTDQQDLVLPSHICWEPHRVVLDSQRLWPGRWRIELLDAQGQVLAETTADVKAGETTTARIEGK